MASKIREEDLRLNLIINGDDGRKKIKEAEDEFNNLQESIRKTRSEMKELERQGKKNTDEYKNLQAELDKNTKSADKAKAKLDALVRSQKIETMTIKELRQHIKNVTRELNQMVPGTPKWKALNAELQATKNRLRELSGTVQQTQGVFDKLGVGKIQAFVGKLFIYYNVLKGIFNLFSGGIRKIKEFEQANANLSTILGVHVSHMTGLTKSALELGRTTEYTASQVTNLQTELAKLGYGQQAILEMEEPVLHFATALGATLPEAAALAGATLRAFDKDVTETDDVLATLAVGCNKSGLSFEYLQTSMSIVSPVAKTFGFNVKDTVALLGTLANSGFDASMAATATRNILLNLADANGKLAKELGKPVRSLPELIEGLQMLDSKGINLAKTLELTDKRSVAAFNTFLRGAGPMGKLRSDLENVDGELKRIAEQRMNTVEGSIKFMQSAWEGFVLAFYNSRGTIKSVVDLITSGIQGITDMMNPDGVVDRLKNEFAHGFMVKYRTDGEEGLKKEIDAGIKYWQEKYDAAKEKYLNSGGFIGKQNYHRMENLYKAFIKAGNETLDRLPQLREEEKDRKEREAEEKVRQQKQKYQEAAAAAYKALTEKEMAERIALKKMYLDGEIATEEEYNQRILQLNIDALKRRLQSSELKGKERLTVEEQLTTLLLQQKKEEQERLDKIETERIKSIADATERENAEYALRRRKAQGNAKLLEQIDAQHARNLAKIQLDKIDAAIKNEENAHKRERQNLQRQQAAELQNFNGTAAEKKRLKEQHNQELLDLDARYASDMAEKLRSLLNDGQFEGLSLDSALLSDEEKDKLVQKFLEVSQLLESLGIQMENLNKPKELNAVGSKDLLGFSLDQWKDLFDNLEKGKCGVQEIGMAITAMTGVFATYDQFATASENRRLKQFKKINDEKKKQLERRLDLGLISQEQYNAKSEQLDEEYQAKEEEIQLKQARRQKAMSIVEAIVNTAVGATAAYKLGPIIGPILAAMISAMGAAQVALIASQPIGGAEEGGVLVTRAQDGKKFKARVEPDKRGYVDKPTVITGENGLEYIIPNEAMRNPTARPVIDIFETVRKQGRLADFNFAEVLPALYAMPGRASGGTATDLPTDAAGGSLPFIDGSDDMKKICKCLEYLCEKADNPRPAVISMLGRGGFVEKYDEYLKYKGNGRLGK